MSYQIGKFLIKVTPDAKMIQEAEEYISWLLEAWKPVIDLLRSNNEVDKRNLIYFWMSKNIELRTKRDNTVEKAMHDYDNDLFKLRDNNQFLSDRIGDTLDHDYQVCYEKSDYIVIWIQKMQGKREKPARWYQIACSKKDAPLFHEYCTRLPRAEKY